MCADKNNESCMGNGASGCCEGFAEIISECCSGSDAADRCAKMKEACGPDCMATFHKMKEKCGGDKGCGC